MTYVANYFQPAKPTSQPVLLLAFWLFVRSQERPSFRKWTFLVGLTSLSDSVWKELHQKHTFFASRERVNVNPLVNLQARLLYVPLLFGKLQLVETDRSLVLRHPNLSRLFATEIHIYCSVYPRFKMNARDAQRVSFLLCLECVCTIPVFPPSSFQFKPGRKWRTYTCPSAFFWSVDRERAKLQALVYDIRPSTTAVFSYGIGSRKLSANEQFFCWCSSSSNFVTNNSNKTRRVIYSRQQSLYQHKYSHNIWIETELFLSPGVDSSHVYVRALALGCFYSHS